MPPKRKRTGGSVDSGENRPSPHRPGNVHLGSGQDRDGDMRGRGGGRGRQNRNQGRLSRRESTESFNNAPTTPRTFTGAMSPPPRPPSISAQSQTQPAFSAPTPPTPLRSPTPEPIKNPSPYDYSHITDQRLATWAAAGQDEVIQAGIQALDDLDILDLSTIFQELIRAGLDGRLKPTEAGACIRAILRPDIAAEEQDGDKIDATSLFLDSLSILADTEPYHPGLRQLVIASGVSPVLMRQMLDTPLLQSLGLTRDTFFKAGIRQVTNLLYRQANHNLLREETEGYSKLVTELFATSAGEPPTSAVVEDTFERVKGLIGTFDLDVGRVLDVTLDVFACVLIKQFRFFVKLLRVSSWWPRDTVLPELATKNGNLPSWALPGSAGWETTEEEQNNAAPARDARDKEFWDRVREIGMDAFYELGGRQPVDAKTKERLALEPSDTDEESDADRQWIAATGTLPPSGNRVAAQLLGFKLRFYTSAAREKDDALPANIIYLAALLIKIGFISLRDLYPHLWPLDEDMEAVRTKRMKEIAEKEKQNRPGGGTNALMMAGALADDTLPANGRLRDAPTSKPDASAAAPVEAEEEKEKLPEPSDQKVLLLINLLTIGAIPESLFMLGRFPWLPEAYPEVLDLLHRILHHSVDKVYKSSQPSNISDYEIPVKKLADSDQNGMPKGSVRRGENPPRKPLRWPYPSTKDVADGIGYKFYWDEWADSIPVCQTVDDIFTLCSTLLNYSGVNIGRDSTLLSKLASIGNKSLSEDPSEANLARWQDLLKRLLVPALSHTKANTNVVNEIYDMLRYYPAPVRYNIYAEWFEGQTSRLPAMTTAFTRARLETLSTMKRISKTNLTTQARALAKTAYANPGIVFKVALDQIESYSNLTEVVVECARYFTDLGYDVLIWSLMSSLGGKSRSRTRDDSALLTSRWLIALSNFSGKVFKRYSIMNPAPILQYVNDQLYRGNSTDLIILQELIAQMSGVVPDTDFTDAQLLAMTGGEVLRRQTLISLQDKRFESMKTAKRLMKSLTETKLAGQLLISIAQHRQSSVYSVPENDAHIKYLSTMIDDAQRILGQFLDLLRSNLSVEQFDDLVPNTYDLMSEFGLEPALAFTIGRASFAYKIANTSSISTTQTSKDQIETNGTTPLLDKDGDIGMDSANSHTSEANNATPGDALAATNGDVEMSETVEVGSSDNIVGSPSTSADSWLDVLAPLINSMPEVLPEKPWNLLNPEFYVIFWQLALSDIQVPMDSYTTENSRLTKEMSDIMKDRSDMSRPGMIRKEEARKAVENTKEHLLNESKDQMSQFGRTRARLNKEKSKWFSGVHGRYDALSDVLIEECFLPRLLLSPSDADYAFKMIKFLHNSATPHFRALGLFGRLFRGNRLRTIIFSCTIREAECFGRFLKSILADLARWHSSKAIYEKEAWGSNQDLPGFARHMREDSKPVSLLEFEDFRRVLFAWHKNLNIALRACLTGTEWMHIRNGITVLKAVVEHFPAVDFMGKAFQNMLTAVAKREDGKREDLCLLANASMPELKKREKKWVMTQAFAINLAESTQVNGAQGKLVEGSIAKTLLKATAPEFKPSPAIISNGKPERVQKGREAEDGEVDDAKSAARKIAAVTPSAPATGPDVTLGTSTQPLQTEISARQDALRNTGVNQTQARLPARQHFTRPPPALERPPTNLPNRPEAPIPGHLQPDRHLPGRGGDRRDMHQSRMDRPTDIPRWSHDNLGQDRRGHDMSNRGLERPSDRVPPFDRDGPRDRHDVIRRGAESFADVKHRERLTVDHRGAERPSREEALALGRSSSAQVDRAPLVNSEPVERLALVDPAINPARAALISGTGDPLRTESPHGYRDDRTHLRPQSPRRGGRHGVPDRDHIDVRREERMSGGRGAGPEMQDSGRIRHDDTQAGPFQPRGTDRPDDRSRDAFQPTQPLPRSVDPDHGRLNQSGRYGESSFGRLNTASDIPSGPRSHGPRGGSRHVSATVGRVDTWQQQGPARPPSPDKMPPTGPAVDRSGRRPDSSGGPTTPSLSGTAASPAPPIHPERLRHLAPEVQIQATQEPAPPPPTAAGVGIHPSRLGAFQSDQSSTGPALPPLQTSNVRDVSTAPSSMTSGPPSGPRGQGAQPSTPTSADSNVPMGPSFPSNERVRGPIRQLAGINSTLQQAGQFDRSKGSDRTNDRGVNIRGRGNITSAAGGQGFPASGPSTPVNTVRPDIRDSGRGRDMTAPEPSPADLFSARINKPSEEDRSDSRTSSTRESGRRERSGRHSRRASRSRSPERERSHRDAGSSADIRAEMGNRADFRESRGGSRRDSDRDIHRRTSGRGLPATAGESGRERDTMRRDGRDMEKSRDGPSMRAFETEFSRGQQYPPQHVPSGRGGEGADRMRDSRSSRGSEDRRDGRSSRDDGTGSIGKRRGEDRGGPDRGRDKRARQS